MKSLLMLVVLVAMGFTSVAVAGNEGLVLGLAWHEYNDAAALIANKENGLWKYDQDMIDANKAAANQGLAQAAMDAEAARKDPKGSVKTGKNSIESLEYLIGRAQHAIKYGADSFDKESAVATKTAAAAATVTVVPTTSTK